MKVEVTTSIEVPKDLFIYDIGAGAIQCMECNSVTHASHGGLFNQADMRDFADQHSKCVVRRVNGQGKP